MKPTKITLKLRADCPPHLFVSQIKKLMDKDQTLHKDMKSMLLYLKKSKQGFIPLSHVQEVIVDFENKRNFQRGIEPQVSAWIRKDMDKEEVEDFKNDSKDYYRGVLNLYKNMGYDFFDEEEVSEEYIQSLVKITKPSKGRNKMRFKKK
jgi:hypothetical protein